jgi:hypothetical protein
MKILILITAFVVGFAPSTNADVRDLSGAFEGETASGAKVKMVVTPRSSSVGTAVVALFLSGGKTMQLLYAERKSVTSMGLKPFKVASGGEDLVMEEPIGSLRQVNNGGKPEIRVTPSTANSGMPEIVFKRKISDFELTLKVPRGTFKDDKVILTFTPTSDIDGEAGGKLFGHSVNADYTVRNEQTGIHTLRKIDENSNFMQIEKPQISAIVVGLIVSGKEKVVVAAPNPETTLWNATQLEKGK